MQLQSIHLKNYRRYRDETIEFPTGIVGIVGRNGSGKSTLIEAIGWCLYGNNAARTKKDQIKTTGIPKGEDCRVVLEFVLDSDAIKIVRELRGESISGHASVFLNGSTTAHVRGMREVSEYVAKRTGMDHVAFFTSVVARQKELDSMSDMQPGERKRTLMRLLRINRIDDAIFAIRADIKESNATITLHEGNLKDVESLKTEHQKVLKEKNQADDQLKDYNQKIKDMTVVKNERKTEFDIYKKKYLEHIALDRKYVKTAEQLRSKIIDRDRIDGDLKSAMGSEEQLKKIRPKIDAYKAVKREKSKLDQLHEKFIKKTSLEDQYNSLLSKINGVDLVNKQAEKDIVPLKNLEQKLQKQKLGLGRKNVRKEELAGSVSEVSSRVKEYKKQKDGYGAKLSTIEKHGMDGSCPTCERPLQDYFSQVSKHFGDQISDLDRKIQKDLKNKKRLKSSLQAVKKNIEKITAAISDTEKLQFKKISLQTRLDEGKKTYAAMDKDKSSLKKQLRSFSKLVYDRNHHLSIDLQYKDLYPIEEESIILSTTIKRIPALVKQRTQCLDAITKLTKLQETKKENLERMGYNRSEHNRSEQALKHATDQLGDAREKRLKLQSSTRITALQIRQIANNIREEKRKRVTIDEEKKKIESRSKLEQVMGDFRLGLISRIRPILSQRSSELLGQITGGKYSRIDLDDDYNMQIEDDGNTFTAARFSGGEGDVANLCLRIAISKELAERAGGAQASFIALDEIFGSQDEERKRNILNALHVLSNQFKQILVITHIEDVKEALPYVLTMRDGPSNTVKVDVEGIASIAVGTVPGHM